MSEALRRRAHRLLEELANSGDSTGREVKRGVCALSLGGWFNRCNVKNFGRQGSEPLGWHAEEEQQKSLRRSQAAGRGPRR